MDYLYHGSAAQYLKVLEPRKRYTPEGKIAYAAVYATPVAAYAAAHSFPWTTDEGVGLDVSDQGVDMSIPVSLRERLQLPISIYKVSSAGFTHTEEEGSGYTWHTTNPVTVIEETRYLSAEAALQELGAKIEYH